MSLATMEATPGDMRYINAIIIHCTATEEHKDYTLADIKAWHTAPPPRGNGWRNCGYHYIVRLDGTVERGMPISQPGIHCRGHNAHSVAVCYVGGLRHGKPADTRTPAQKQALLKLIAKLTLMYRCHTYGHRDFAAKDCPCFDAKTEYAGLFNQLVRD